MSLCQQIEEIAHSYDGDNRKVLIELFQKFTVSKGGAFGGILKGKAL